MRIRNEIETARGGRSRGHGWPIVVPVLALLLTVAPASAQLAATGGMSGFEPVGFEVELQGKTLGDARVLQSKIAGAYLIMTPELAAPVLIRLREQSVETLDLMKIDEKVDGSVDILPNATLARQGGYQVNAERTGVKFAVDGIPVEMKEKAPLLGDQDLAALESYDPSYGRTAAEYEPSPSIVDRLGTVSDEVRVVVFFGSWCPACKQMVPRMMRVAEELGQSGIDFEFYGLPRGFGDDAKAKSADIKGVPTGVVYVDGKEVGRIQGNSWRVPELALNSLLKNSIPSS